MGVAGVADTNTIDMVARDADGTYLLVMIEDRPWGAVDDQEAQLREKINNYAGYVLDGSLAETYPETAGKPVRIRLDCLEEPRGHFAHIADHAAAQLAAHDIGFQVSPKS
jgi:hypothetical protein